MEIVRPKINIQFYPAKKRIVPNCKLCKVIHNLTRDEYDSMVVDGKNRRIIEMGKRVTAKSTRPTKFQTPTNTTTPIRLPNSLATSLACAFPTSQSATVASRPPSYFAA